MSKEKTEKTIKEKTIPMALQKAISGGVEVISMLSGQVSKSAAFARIKEYVGKNRDRWNQFAAGLKTHLKFSEMKSENDKRQLINHLSYIRKLVGVTALKRRPAGTGKDKIKNLSSETPKAETVEAPKTQNERIQFILKKLSEIDEALNCERADTIELIMLATQERGKRKVA